MTTQALELEKLEAQINQKLKEYEAEGIDIDQFKSLGDSSHFSFLESKL